MKREYPNALVSTKKLGRCVVTQSPVEIGKWIPGAGRIIKFHHDRLASPPGGEADGSRAVVVREANFSIAVETNLFNVRKRPEHKMVGLQSVYGNLSNDGSAPIGFRVW